LSANWNGYFGDVARTAIAASPSRQQQEIFTPVYEACAQHLAKMRPGCANQDAAQAIIRRRRNTIWENVLVALHRHGRRHRPKRTAYIGEILYRRAVYEFQPGDGFAVEPLNLVEGRARRWGVRLERWSL